MQMPQSAEASGRIAVDAMGGDHAPERPVEGAVLAVRELGIPVTLVGREVEVRRALSAHDVAHLDIEIVNADDVIEMDDEVVTALRKKKNSSLRVAAKLVRDGQATAMVSAGNTGAVMAVAKIVIGTLTGINRPALTTTVPNVRSKTVWLDVGANVEVKPEGFREFAIMGRIYACDILGIDNPRIGLLSVGAEEGKGTDLTRETHKLLKSDVPNFIGNVEGRDLFNGSCDVVVCDGFTGNVSLKALESVVETLQLFLRQEMERSWRTKLGFLLARPAFRSFKKRVDYAEFGGAPLLGLRGCTLICHGGSSSLALRNAVRAAQEYVRKGVSRRIEQRMGELIAARSELRAIEAPVGRAAGS
jgi:glycerol-3-phosphate acyltransferase PlsX